MKMREYTKGEWKKIQDQPLKVRLAYFWDYYKLHTIMTLLLVAAVVYTVNVQLNRKEDALNGVLINSSVPLEEPAFLQAFCDDSGIDTGKKEITLQAGLSLTSDVMSTGLMTYQRIHAGIAAEETDFLIGDASAMQRCGYDSSHMLMDLRQFLSPEQLAQLEPFLYYIDGSLLGQQEITEEMLDPQTAQSALPSYPSPYAPEQMEDPIPVGVDIHRCTEFLDSYYATNQQLYFAVVCNAPHRQTTLQFFEYIMEHTDKE